MIVKKHDNNSKKCFNYVVCIFTTAIIQIDIQSKEKKNKECKRTGLIYIYIIFPKVLLPLGRDIPKRK